MTAPNDAQDVPVGAIQPSNKTPNVASSIRHDDKLRLDAPIEQSTMSAQTIAPAPAIERLNQAHGVTITAPNNAGDVPVRGDSPQQQNSERGVPQPGMTALAANKARCPPPRAGALNKVDGNKAGVSASVDGLLRRSRVFFPIACAPTRTGGVW